MPPSRRFVTLLAANADSFYQALCEYLSAQCELDLASVNAVPWQQRALWLAQGEVDVAAVCGAVYIDPLDQVPALQLLAAPVMAQARYANRPVYFSDVIVRADSRFAQFADLRGAVFAVNEPGSFSGYAVVAAGLAALGEDADYFAAVRETGAHAESLRAVLEQRADAAAIDSIVLHQTLRLQPELREQVRVIHAFGPNPAPPIVAARHVAPAEAAQLRATLLAMHTDRAGQAVLAIADVARFAAVTDADYDLLRERMRQAATVPLREVRGQIAS